MNHIGEIISLIVAVSWTVTALFADKASHRLGSMTANVLRLSMAVVFLGLLLWMTVGHPYPVYASGKAWWWLALMALQRDLPQLRSAVHDWTGGRTCGNPPGFTPRLRCRGGGGSGRSFWRSRRSR